MSETPRADEASGPAPKADRFYHPEIDGLRFVAFFAVFLHHALPQEPIPKIAARFPELAEWIAGAARSGGYGVDLFFVLSSYLITELLLREREARGTVDVKSFYIRRALRIWPLYYAFLLFAVLVVPRIFEGHGLSGRHTLGFAVFGANWACAILGYPSSPAAPLWSVSIEEQFYLVWPLVMRGATKQRLIVVSAVMIAVAVTARIVLAQLSVPHPGTWCNTFARLDPIALGTLAAALLHRRRFELSTAARWGLGLASLFAIVAVARFSKFEGRWDPSAAYPIVALACVGVLLSVLSDDAPGREVRHPLARPAVVYLGRISYGLYVFHALGLLVANALLAGLSPIARFGPRMVIAFVVTLVLSALSYRFLEEPFLKLKQRFTHVASRPGG